MERRLAAILADNVVVRLEDAFIVQDDGAVAILEGISEHINRLLMERVCRRTPRNLTPLDPDLRGRWALTHWNTDLAEGLEWLKKLVETDTY